MFVRCSISFPRDSIFSAFEKDIMPLINSATLYQSSYDNKRLARPISIGARGKELAEVGEQDAAGEDGADLARDVRAYGVHEKVVAGVGLLSEALDDAR